MDIVPLREQHLEDAARLFAATYAQQRRAVPVLPERPNLVGEIASKLADLIAREPAAAAIEDGRLAGYLGGFGIPEFKGTRPGVVCPEWAHGAAGPNRAAVSHALYAALAQEWVATGKTTHAVVLMAHDREMHDAWFWHGFGMVCVDLARALAAVGGDRPAGLVVRRAAIGDAPALAVLEKRLQQHLTASPVFLHGNEDEGVAGREAWLAEEGHAAWVAALDGEPVAFMQCEPASFGAAYTVSGDDNTAITGAYTRKDVRAQGIGAALLDEGLGWALEQGLARCSVDFEPQNAVGGRFWTRHFAQVCYSVLRKVDERMAG